MATCVICHFPTPLDDVVLPSGSGQCICLRCFLRETGGMMPVPKALQRILSATLAACEG